ncbi:hypothetical protein ACA910_017353 [Epithemia clementina (nom. ined.)]
MVKSEAELEAERKKAAEKLEGILDATRPKNFRQGLGSGLSNIVSGAVGGAGVAVLLPVMGFAVGARHAGILGGVFGLTAGAIGGALGAAALIVGGAVSGVVQMVRGVAAVPQQIAAPRQGKWWNEYEGRWIKTNMPEEAAKVESVPEDNSDLLGEVKAKLDDKKDEGNKTEVVDMYYYEVLDVEVNADQGTIKRRYYKLAREYHPDKNPGNDEAAEKFKVIGEAYQVLSDNEKRKKYDEQGREGLKKNENDSDEAPKIDPVILYAFLFGSDKFKDITGPLASATSASVGDSRDVSPKTARIIQKRRVVRLAVKLVDRIEGYVNLRKAGNEDPSEFVAKWTAEGQDLSTASFGYPMVTLCGQVYNLIATKHIGSLENGYGLPAMAEWADAHHARMQERKAKNKNQMDQLRAGMDMIKLSAEYQNKIQSAKTDEERETLKNEMQKAAVEITLRILWTTNVVDISATLHETCMMVFHDDVVDKETRKFRAEAVQKLGEVWMNMEAPEGTSAEEKDAVRMYEEAAFAAMLETIKRKDEAANSSE